VDITETLTRWHNAAQFLSEQYLQNQFLIDLALFALLFTSLARASLKERLPGPSGKVASVTFGVALAISLTMGMERWGVSLLDLAIAPLVLMAILMCLMGLSLYKKAPVGIPTIAGVALLMIGIVLAAGFRMERLFASVDTNLVVIVLGLVLVGRLLLGIRVGESGRGEQGHIGEARPETRRKTKEYTHGIAVHGRWAIQRSWELMQRMKRLMTAWRVPTGERPPRQALEKALLDLDVLEAELDQRLRSIRKTTQQLERTEAKVYGELTRGASHTDGTERSKASRQLSLEWTKLRGEDDLRRIARKAEHHVRKIRHCLSKAKRQTEKANESSAEEWLETALERQQQLLELLTKLAEWEHRVEQLAERQAENKTGNK